MFKHANIDNKFQLVQNHNSVSGLGTVHETRHGGRDLRMKQKNVTVNGGCVRDSRSNQMVCNAEGKLIF